ncbi:MAG: hypothetical protein ABR512_07160 [Desulfopila sp.]
MSKGEAMKNKKCPDCGATAFYVKDSEDQYNICEFSLEEGGVVYKDEMVEAERLPVFEDSEIFCDRCAWHDKHKVL